MNETNPWLNITKQKTVDRPGIAVEVIHFRFSDVPLQDRDLLDLEALNECYDPDDLRFAEQFIEDMQYLTPTELSFEYFKYWSFQEMEEILQWAVNGNSMPLPHELVDYLYDNGFWQK